MGQTGHDGTGGGDSGGDEEELQASGSASMVWRVGSTARRAGYPATPTLQRLLAHVRARGFDAAPTYVGVDDRGRDVFEWIEGESLPGDLSDEQVAQVGRMIRRYHDAVADFPETVGCEWREEEPGGSHQADPDWNVLHGDINQGNIICREGEIVGLIDWDFARPGPPIQDLAYAAMRCVPVQPPRGDRAGAAAEQARRTLLLCDSYGLSAAQVAALPEQMAFMFADGPGAFARRARRGDAGATMLWNEGRLLGFFADMLTWFGDVRVELESAIRSNGRTS